MAIITKEQYSELRKGQKEMIEHIKNAFQKDEIALIEAPTGMGKSRAGIYGILPFIKDGKKVFWTSRDIRTYETPIKEVMRLNKKIIFAQFRAKQSLCLNELVNSSKNFIMDCSHAKRYHRCIYYENVTNKYDSEKRKEIITERAEKLVVKFIREIKNNKWEYRNNNYNLSNYVKNECSGKYCPYEIMRLIAKESDIIFCDYWYILFNSFRDIWLEKTNSRLNDTILVIDEADDLILRLKQSMSRELSDVTIDRLSKMCNNEIEIWTKKYEDVLKDFRDNLVDRIKVDDVERRINSLNILLNKIKVIKKTVSNLFYKTLKGEVDNVFSIDEFIQDYLYPEIEEEKIIENLQYDFITPLNDLEELLKIEADKKSPKPSRFFYVLMRLIESNLKEKYVVEVKREQGRKFMKYKLILTPLDESECLADGNETISQILSKPEKTLIMSATLGNPETFAQVIGLKKYYPYTITNFHISEDQYMIVALNNYTSYYNSRWLNSKKYRELMNLITLEIPNIKKLAVFTSGDFQNDITQNNKLDDWTTIIFAGKGSKGTDYPNHLINLLVGYPEQRKSKFNTIKESYLINKYGEKKGLEIYNHVTIAKIIQAMGRTLRKDEDRSIILLADLRYKKKNIKSRLPTFYKRRYVEINNKEELLTIIKSFTSNENKLSLKEPSEHQNIKIELSNFL